MVGRWNSSRRLFRMAYLAIHSSFVVEVRNSRNDGLVLAMKKDTALENGPFLSPSPSGEGLGWGPSPSAAPVGRPHPPTPSPEGEGE